MSGSWLLRYGRDPAVAIDLMRFTVAAYPEFVQGYVNLARALLANGDRASAEAHCRRALAMAPEDSDAQKLLIECTAEQTGKPD
jgi:predicted Zn-dependent protease